MSVYDALPTLPPLTDEQRAALVQWVFTAGRERRRVQGSEFNESDFIAGAMVAFFAFSMQDKLPSGWVFGPLSGRSAFADPEPAEVAP